MKGLMMAVLVTAAFAASAAENWLTFKFENGRAWNEFSENEKMFYLAGFEAGLFAVARTENGTSCGELNRNTLNSHTMIGFKRRETIAALDRFYAEPENLLITIIGGMEIISAKSRGVPQKVIEERLAQQRATALAAPERKQ